MKITAPMFNFTLITPKQGMDTVFRKIAKEFPCKLNILRDGERAITTFDERIFENCDAILCRRVIAQQLRETTSLPIIRIELTNMDLLRILAPYKSIIKKVAVFRADAPLSNIDIIANVLSMQIYQFSFEKIEVLEKQIQMLPKDFDLIVGGMQTYNVAMPLGLHTINIVDEEEIARRSLREAMQIAEAKREASKQTSTYSFMLENMSNGLILINSTGIVQVMNSVAENILKCKKEQILGRNIVDCFPSIFIEEDLTNYAEYFRIWESRNGAIIISSTPLVERDIEAGKFFQLSSVADLEKTLKISSPEQTPHGFATKYTFEDIQSSSESMDNLKNTAKIYASTEATILITGESGTGKELLAQSIHKGSLRGENPFVAVNCAAIPEGLLESELFGYEGGAFTGARRTGKAGMFELAQRGTLFLDEIGDLPFALQGRLLRVLQEKEIIRIGGTKLIPLDVRIICATHDDLYDKVESGRFRADLFYRLNILSLVIPSLRERPCDILYLAMHYLAKYLDTPPSNQVMKNELAPILLSHTWPGNVRELYSVLERLIIVSNINNTVTWKDRLSSVWQIRQTKKQNTFCNDLLSSDVAEELCVNNHMILFSTEKETLKSRVQNFEENIISKTLETYGHDYEQAAKALGISRMTLWRKRHSKG